MKDLKLFVMVIQVVHPNQTGVIETTTLSCDTLEILYERAKQYSDTIQSKDPLFQLTFNLFRADCIPMIWPEWLTKKLIEDDSDVTP